MCTFPVKEPFESRLQFIGMGKYGDGILSYMYTKTTQYAIISDSELYIHLIYSSVTLLAFLSIKRELFFQMIFMFSLGLTQATRVLS